ncbi:carbon-nitrogen hydrolase family protein [Arthrobacter sp. SDTb3-6]|uniref:carbon-nitrogen hydrolase family protein n=1 Tax=Arthrobacter sp. SDTb3-6 TaxID=2713571 RepID=UPI00159E2F9F|nr:carbon-nitrogen hydrolase family protein [Arthrobacter sp. SDTb3-6]NVM99861.1 carbon-nitrogen hydrolase family protein [Arthrobacter sp. SDTb3-6]
MSINTKVSISVQQIASTGDPQVNLTIALEAIRSGAATGARIVVLPEATHVRFGVDSTPHAESLDGPWATAIRKLANELDVYVLVGMFQPADNGRVMNTILVTGPGLHSGYNKIHLYEAYGFSESAAVQAGNVPFTFEVDGMKFGVATCYDIRFPELFRAYADLGATAVLVPTHWGAGEGKLDAWTLLSRARALDSTTWIVSCDQADASTVGIDEPAGPRFGIGHSMAINPLGQIIEELDDKVGAFVVTVDTETVEQARQIVPVLATRKLGIVVPV